MAVSFSAFKKSLMSAAEALGSKEDVAICQRVIGQTAHFLTDNGASTEGVGALETIGSMTVPKINTGLIQSGELSAAKLIEFVRNCRVPKDHQMSVATECARILSGDITLQTNFQSPDLDAGKDVISVESYAGKGMKNNIMSIHQNAMSNEAFGGDIDRLAQDNRMSIVLTVLRPFSSIIDKILPRVMEESNIVTVAIPAPEVYDLAASMNASSQVRNSAQTRYPLVELYKNPDVVSTQQRPVVAQKANDTGAVQVVFDNNGTLVTGVPANLFDLTMNSSVVGFTAVDYTDLIAEGGRVSNLVIQAANTVNGTTTVELFNLPVRYLPSAPYVPQPNNVDSGDMIATMIAPFIVRPGSLTTTGTASVIFAGFTDSVVQLDSNFTSTLSLKTGNITGAGSVFPVLKPRAGVQNSAATTVAAFQNIKFSIVGYFPELYFDEENLRKTTTAIRVYYLERQFVIPMGRNYIVDYALQQGDDPKVAETTNRVTSLGNSARGLGIMLSRMNDVSAALAFQAANPEQSSSISPTRLSFAATLCLPYVVKGQLDYSDAKTAVMRETERLSDMHARMREALLLSLAQVCAESLYLVNLEAGETPVFRLLTYTVIADVVMGIVDYHNTLNDVVKIDTGVDYSFQLPNGYRIDIIKTNFLDYQNTCMIVPVREAAPRDITSFATIRDRGTYTAQYTPISNGAVARRCVTNTREIVFVTNPIGVILTVLGLGAEVGVYAPQM